LECQVLFLFPPNCDDHLPIPLYHNRYRVTDVVCVVFNMKLLVIFVTSCYLSCRELWWRFLILIKLILCSTISISLFRFWTEYRSFQMGSLCWSLVILEKVYLTPWTISGSLLHPPTLKPSTLPPKQSKTGQITSSGGFGRRFCYSNTILSLSFFLFSLNLWKIIVNHRKIIK